MGKRGFTLIELSIVLTIIGLMIGGSFKMMKMMREKAKIAEAKEQVLGAKNAVLGYASKEYFLPLNNEFDDNLSTSKDPNHPIFYTADNNLKYDDICAFTTTSLKVNNRGITIDKVAFVIAHEGANYNLQTGLDANNTVKIYSPSDKVDDNITLMNNANHEYDDIVEWVTLDQLKNEIGCADRPFRFITDKLPNAKVGVVYPSISGTAKLEVENNISTVTITCNPSSLYDINFTSPNFSGTPSYAGTATFNCSATENPPSSRTITREFVITIDPYLNKAKDLNCTQDSECASGICYGGICRSGTANESCGNGGDCQSGICVSGICRSGVASDPCVIGGDCQSGLCIGGVCQAGAVGNACTDNGNCLSGFCAGGVCTTGAFDVNCDNGSDCKSGICQGGLCSGYINDRCTANAECLSGYCDSNRSVCASIPYDTNSTSGGGGGGGGGGVAPSCSLAGSVPVVNINSPATLNYTIVGGPASGTFSPSSGACSNFSNSTGGSCTTANLTRNTLFALSVTNAYGSGACSTGVCVATRTEYRIYNDTGARRDFMVDGICRRVNNGSEITTTSPLRRLNSGESIIGYSSSNTTCSGEVGRITFNQAVCADTDADGLVNFSGPTDR